MKRVPVLSSLLALVFSSLLVMSPAASAQSLAGSLPGITVTGTGTASAPAEMATVVIMVGSDPYLYSEAGAMGQAGTTPSAPIVTAEEIAAPVVDALVAAGLSSADIEIISNPYMGGYGPYGGPQSVTIRFQLADPTVERITGLLDPAIAAAMGARLFINMTSVVYSVADCAPLQLESREAAIANGRDTAELQAGALGVSIGDVVASRDLPFGYYASPYSGVPPVNPCTSGGADPKVISMYGAPAFDPTLPAEVIVTSSVELTFGIVGDMQATPES